MTSIRMNHEAVLMVGVLSFVVGWAGCASSTRRMSHDVQGMDAAPFRRMRIDRMLRDGRFDDAVSAYRALLNEPLDDPVEAATIRHHLSKAYWGRQGRTGGRRATDESRAADRLAAIQSARAAFEALDAKPADSGGISVGTVGRSLGTYLRADGLIDEAVEVYQRLLAVRPEATIDRVRTLYELGNTYLQRSERPADQFPAGSNATKDFRAALQYLDDALTLARRLETCPPVLLVSIYNSLGLIHNVQLQPATAVERFAEAEQLCEEHAIADAHAEVLQNLILALIETGQYKEARQRCNQLERLPDLATNPRTMTALGFALFKLGRFAQARQQFDLARYLVGQNPETAKDLSFLAQLACNAASVAQAMGDYDEAERFLRDARRDLAAGGVDARTAAVVQANLGRLYLTLERLDDAQKQLDEVFNVFSRLQGPHHPDTLMIQLDLANLARARGHLAEARQLCEKAVRGLIAARGKEHPAVAQARMELATLYRDQGHCPEALSQARQAQETLDAVLGSDHQQAVIAYLKMALIAADGRDASDDDGSFNHILTEAGRRYTALRDALGPDNVEVLRAMVYFADVTAKTPTALATALERYRQAEEGFLEHYASSAKSLAALRLKQGRLLFRMKRFDEAHETCDRALRLMDRSLQQQPIHAGLLTTLGDIYDAQALHDQATKPWREALRILTATYGADHPRVVQFREQRKDR